jgi:1,4-dihydroxy-6-naphthoate synthase
LNKPKIKSLKGLNITFGHSPDADDAFMFYGLAKNKIPINFKVSHLMEDIESLNKRATLGNLEVTAISAAHYPKVSDHYQIMSCGSSVGRNYGPILVSDKKINENKLSGLKIAIPGEFTTSYLLFKIFISQNIKTVFKHFDDVINSIKSGETDAGILLHEGQVTFQEYGLNKILDLGERWFQETSLPIPLGLDLVHKKFSPENRKEITTGFYKSIKYALENEEKALDYALGFGRGIQKEKGRKFVRMYVNNDTLNMGQEGLDALNKLFQFAKESEIIDKQPNIELCIPEN